MAPGLHYVYVHRGFASYANGETWCLSERGDTSGEDAEVMNAEAGHRALVEAMHRVQLSK